MKSQLNKNEFYRCRKYYDEACKLKEMNETKSAIAALKPAIKTLEKDTHQTRMLAKAYILMAELLQESRQASKAAAFWQNAANTLERIEDHGTLMEYVKEQLEK